MERFPCPASAVRWALFLLLAFAVGGCSSKDKPAPVNPDGMRVDPKDDGSKIVTFTGWKGKTDDYRLVEDHPKASVVRMANADVTDEVLLLLKGLDQLRELDLSNTKVTDEGLKGLQGLEKLEILELANTQVTDKCFNSLAGLASLRRLVLLGTKVSPEAAAKWKEAKPGRRVQQ